MKPSIGSSGHSSDKIINEEMIKKVDFLVGPMECNLKGRSSRLHPGCHIITMSQDEVPTLHYTREVRKNQESELRRDTIQ